MFCNMYIVKRVCYVCLSLVILLITGILHWLSSVYWAINQDTDAIWVEMAMGNAHI